MNNALKDEECFGRGLKHLTKKECELPGPDLKDRVFRRNWMKESIISAVSDGVSAMQQLMAEDGVRFIGDVSQLLSEIFCRGGKVLVAGNGGSLCDANHFAEELTGQFRSYRRALPAIALSAPSHITCVGNDMGFDRIFARGVEALGVEGDVFVGLSTSGNSTNIVAAMEEAKKRRLSTVAFLGKGGGVLKGAADHEIIIDGFSTSDRIQEAHMAAIHIIIEHVEQLLFSMTEGEMVNA